MVDEQSPNNHWSTLLYDKAKGNIKPLSICDWLTEGWYDSVCYNMKGRLMGGSKAHTAEDVFKLNKVCAAECFCSILNVLGFDPNCFCIGPANFV